MRRMTAALLLALTLCFLAAPAPAEDHSLKQGRVTFSAPGEWDVQGHEQGGVNEYLVLNVPFTPTLGTRDVAQAQFAAWDNVGNMVMATFSDPIVEGALAESNARMVADAKQKKWRLFLLAGDQEGTPHLFMNFCAVTDQTMFWFRLSWPDTAGMNEDMVALGNDVLATLAVDGESVPKGLQLDSYALPAPAAQ